MKFSSDIVVTANEDTKQIKDDVTELRNQLETCRSTLQLQTSRSHQIVSAYRTKLRDKEDELCKAKIYYDNRLATIARALMVLESKMKQEQRLIKSQLAEKDDLILEQQRIISSLMDHYSLSSGVSSPNSSTTSTENSPQTKEETIIITKPSLPPKPSSLTPYKPNIPFKPILKLSKKPSFNKKVSTRSLPELSYAKQRAAEQEKRGTSDHLEFRPVKLTKSTCQLHATSEIDISSDIDTSNDQSTKEQEQIFSSPHRVSRMVQRFDKSSSTFLRSSSCSALPSSRLSEHRHSSPNNCDSPPEVRSAVSDTEDIENRPDDLRGNFVEFHLDSDNSEEEEICLRKDGDGAEIKNNQNGVKDLKSSSYEGFLEATGLSQKSILTPSRLISVANNTHRSVLKPRDVKVRSKANRCFNAGTVKYWSGPYL